MVNSAAANNGERGIVYVATGESYVNEAIASALSCRAQMPIVPIHLFTDIPTQHSVFESVSLLDGIAHRTADKILPLIRSPYERTVFLDTDTFVCDGFEEVFELLDRFDLAAAHSPKRMAYTDKNFRLPEEQRRIPSAFPELNTGVIAFRKNAATDDLFRHWHVWYTYALKRGDNDFRPQDQPAFRVALFESQCRYYVLTPEYNCRLSIPSYICGRAKILHGRAEKIDEIAGLINSEDLPRAHVNRRLFFRSPSGWNVPQSANILVLHAQPQSVQRRPFKTRADLRRPFLTAAALRIRRLLRYRIAAGPFAGMRFHKPVTGITYYPKLLGTYELELHPIIQEICNIGFERIVNAGSADGYFSVGLARCIPRASIISFEARNDRRVLIRQLAEINDVASRIQIMGQCNPGGLSESLKGAERPLVFMDVEGAEDQLLEPSAVPELRSAFILVEIHEAARPGVSSRLAARFADTHSLSVISMRARFPGDFPLRKSAGKRLFRPSTRLALMNENRFSPVGWLCFRPHQRLRAI